MIRAAVIGVGAMGRNHARVYSELPGVELVAVSDLDVSLVESVAQHHGALAYSEHRQMLQEARPQIVSVSVPTQEHCEVTLDVLSAGCHVLVEKPISATPEEGRRMIAAASEAGRVLAVGHVERYNPAVIELKRRLDAGEVGRIFKIHARRVGPFPARVRDVGVVVDLAPHDLDIMRYLTGSEAQRLYAETERQIHTSHEDLFTGLVRFRDGVLGVLDINWLTPTKIREITVLGQLGMFVANLITQDLYFYENDQASGLSWSNLSLLRGVSEGQMIRFKLHRQEPLRAELEAFAAVAQGEQARIVTGQDGLAALELALKLVQSGRQATVVE